MPNSLVANIVVFLCASLVVAVAGVRLTSVAKSLAAATGIGQALFGGIVIGVITSLAGTVTSVVAALDNHPDIAFGNAVGGIAAQTTFLVVADLFYRRANLEHAAAAEVNLLQCAVLIFLLSIALLGMVASDAAILGIHPVSAALVVTYLFCVRLISNSQRRPMWYPRRTAATTEEIPAEGARRAVSEREWLYFAVLVSIVAVMGWLVARTGSAIASGSGLSDSVVGVIFTSISTSLPELVVAVAAVRRGALNLALGDILGGNTFDVLFLSASDIAYRNGSIYHAVSRLQTVWIVLCIVMTSVLLLGLLRRQRRGVANIGFESALVIVLYVGAVVFLFAW